MNFENTIQNLKLEKDNSIAQECLNAMLHEEVIFNSGFEQEAEHLTSLYEFRLKTIKDVRKDQVKQDEIISWEIAIENLKKSSAKKLILNWVRSESKNFMMFWDHESKQLAGIFYAYSKTPMKEQEAYNSGIRNRGFSVSCIKYNAGQKVRDWK